MLTFMMSNFDSFDNDEWIPVRMLGQGESPLLYSGLGHTCRGLGLIVALVFRWLRSGRVLAKARQSRSDGG